MSTKSVIIIMVIVLVAFGLWEFVIRDLLAPKA